MNSQFLNLNKKVKKKTIQQMNNFIVQDGQIYTHEGENISDLYSLQLNPKYISDKQLKEYISKETLGEHERENGGFVFLFYQTLTNIKDISNLSKPDIARLMYLITYISFESNIISFDNGREITDKQLMNMLKLNNQSYKKYISKLIDNNILYIDENKNKYISTTICKYGKIDKGQLHKTDTRYIRLFKATVRNLFNETTVRELGRLSTIYMILPYLNLTTNIISHNPDETDIDKIKPMTLIELSKVLGYADYTKLKKSLYSIKIDNSYVFGFFLHENDKRTMKIVVNPRVVFAGNGQQLGAVKALFNK